MHRNKGGGNNRRSKPVKLVNKQFTFLPDEENYHFGVGGGFSARTNPRTGARPSEQRRGVDDDVAVTSDDAISVESSRFEEGF